MAVKRRQKDDNHGTLEDKSQGPLVSDKGRERDGSQGRSGNKTQDSFTFAFINLHRCVEGSCVVIKAELLPISNPGLCSMISERL